MTWLLQHQFHLYGMIVTSPQFQAYLDCYNTSFMYDSKSVHSFMHD